MVGGAIGGWSLDRGHRARGRPGPIHVSYWARKHGLTSSHAARHAARGPIERELLAEIVACRLSIRDMADVFDRSPSTIRRWLAKHGITPAASARRGAGAVASAAQTTTPDLPCPTHGVHTPRPARRRQLPLRALSQRASRRRGAAASSGSSSTRPAGAARCAAMTRCVAALQFHHVDPGAKSFAISRAGVTRALSKAREEAAKCVLLCANCHAEVEAGLAQLPLRSDDHGHVLSSGSANTSLSGVAQSGRAFDC